MTLLLLLLVSTLIAVWMLGDLLHITKDDES